MTRPKKKDRLIFTHNLYTCIDIVIRLYAHQLSVEISTVATSTVVLSEYLRILHPSCYMCQVLKPSKISVRSGRLQMPVETLTYISAAEGFIHSEKPAFSIDPREQTWPPAVAPPTSRPPLPTPRTSNLGCVFRLSHPYPGVAKFSLEQFLA